MYFIDGSYFINDIRIPNIKENGTYTNDINNAITKYEKEILIHLLGYELYKALIADLNASKEPQSDRFKALVNGDEFTHPDTEQLLKWVGLKNTEKESLIAYYVYYNYVYNNNIQLSGIGNIKHEAEKAVNQSPFDKLEIAWRSFMKLYANFELEVNDIYFCEDGTKAEDLQGTFNGLASAYNFLYANKDTYPEWVFTPIYDKNIFSL